MSVHPSLMCTIYSAKTVLNSFIPSDMTRGTAILLLENTFIYSDEFNGDMAFEDLGSNLVAFLMGVVTSVDFKAVLMVFNQENHQYSEVENHEDKLILDTSGKYAVLEQRDLKCTSDYTYIKNRSGLTINFVCDNGNKILMEDGCVVVLNFGKRVLKTYTDEV